MTVGNLVRQARRRILGNQLFTQGANAGIAALVAFILLLLFGTQMLSWPVALAVPLAAAAFGMYRVKRQMPSPYGVAQLIDQRLGLADNLSPAFAKLTRAGGGSPPPRGPPPLATQPRAHPITPPPPPFFTNGARGAWV